MVRVATLTTRIEVMTRVTLEQEVGNWHLVDRVLYHQHTAHIGNDSRDVGYGCKKDYVPFSTTIYKWRCCRCQAVPPEEIQEAALLVQAVCSKGSDGGFPVIQLDDGPNLCLPR